MKEREQKGSFQGVGNVLFLVLVSAGYVDMFSL